MEISVIIPTFNRAHTLKRALDSVLAQTYAASEIIVVDDASTDNTKELLRAYSGVKTLFLTGNKGVSAARNKGIAHANSAWIALLDSDDAWAPEKLEAQVAAANSEIETKIIHTDEVWIRNGKRVNAKNKHAKPNGWVYEASLPLCCVSPSSILIHQSVFQACGKFDESFPACEDYDLWLRCFNQFPVTLVAQLLTIKYGGHDDQLSRKYWGMDRFRVKALIKMLESGQLNNKNKRLTQEMLREKCRILALGAAKRGKRQEVEYYQQIVIDYA